MNHFYHPQTKFAKVMLSQVFVCPQSCLSAGVGFLSGGRVSVREIPPIRLRAGGTHPTGMHSCTRYILFGVFRVVPLSELNGLK